MRKTKRNASDKARCHRRFSLKETEISRAVDCGGIMAGPKVRQHKVERAITGPCAGMCA
jgi:hypothetical protein